MMLTFLLRGHIADIDESTSDESIEPTTVLIVETVGEFFRVLVPDAVLQDQGELLCAGRAAALSGELEKMPVGPVHVATELRLIGPAH